MYKYRYTRVHVTMPVCTYKHLRVSNTQTHMAMHTLGAPRSLTHSGERKQKTGLFLSLGFVFLPLHLQLLRARAVLQTLLL